MANMNMGNMMKQAQKLQAQLKAMQEECKRKTVEVSLGGGAIVLVMTGEKLVQSIKLDKNAVDPDDVESLQDLIVSAVNEAVRKVDEMTAREMSKITASLGLPPGLF